MSAQDRSKRLYRSRNNRLLAGVCGGIAEYFRWDPTLVRLLFVASLLLPGPQVVAYLVAWIVIPPEP
jgi:phage shock protein C